MTFWTTLGVTTLGVALLSGFIYWICAGVKKINPNFRYWCKYTLFKRKYNEKAVRWCMKAHREGTTEEDVTRFLLTAGTPLEQVKETIYVFQQINNKGGITNE